MTTKKIKVLIAKPGLDGHDVGAKVVVRAMMEAGFETIYSGLRRTPEAITQQARDEGVDVIGLSILSGSHKPLCEKMRQLSIQGGLEDKLWIVGGNIPEDDRQYLQQLGFLGVFPTEARLNNIIEFIREHAS
ncbi:MAG: cobalamin-dependent protein [Arenicellales bacterium]|jgi:methylmalonyl-CoA mutase C-terminal domain/subunit|nr:cobalamin-dependent protein [Arenicellales bacterium]|tara:strand:+ start:7940 stop:8335 length:396 start_codon:yes stop_codon:yes gene_type:complete